MEQSNRRREELPVKIGIIPENLVERLALALGLVLAPAFEARFSFMLARAIMAGTKLGIFEALATGPLTGTEVADRCGTDRRATGKLLNALAGAGWVDVNVKDGRYKLASAACRCLSTSSPDSWRDQTLLHYLEWHWWDHCEEYGVPISTEKKQRAWARDPDSPCWVFPNKGT
jgi:Dimerisation domain